jgi:hypothetical protein
MADLPSGSAGRASDDVVSERRMAGYCGGIITHAATSGLLAGTGLRQVADSHYE